ncbi:hypothetical protein G9A89_003771 [Geosiphon pyriformis]|nr:hypothetical protein G9A89_003771 [Geosiphon pyriformis]
MSFGFGSGFPASTTTGNTGFGGNGFGSNLQQNTAAFGFGATPAATAANTGFGGGGGFGNTRSFGTNTAGFGTATGGFGASGGLGGGTGFSNLPSTLGASGGPGVGAFGNTGAGAFGLTQASSGSGFGNAPGAFGGTFSSNIQPAFGSGAFGAAASTAAPTGFGSFGAPAKTSSSIFGFITQPSNNTGGFGGFGAQQQTQTNAFSFPAVTPSKPMFGFSGFAGNQTTAPASGFGTGGSGGIFGTNTQSTQQSTPFGIGSTGPQSNTFSGFGQPAATGGTFGAQKPTWFFPSTTTTTPSLNSSSFNPPAASTAANGFSFTGGNTSSILGMNTTQQQLYLQQQQQQQLAGSVEKSPFEKLVELGSAWDPTSLEYKFQHYFYSMVHPKDMKAYGPPTDRPSILWEKAQKENPDPSCLVPVLSIGFDGVKKRIEFEQKFSEMCKTKLEELERQIKNMQDKHHMENLVKIDQCKQKTLEITQRMITVMKQLHLKKLQGKAFRPEDERTQAELERIQQRLQRPLQKLEQLNTQASIMKVQMSSQIPTQKYNVVDERQLGSIIEVLADEQQGITHLINTVQRDSEDVQEMHNSLMKKLLE